MSDIQIKGFVAFLLIVAQNFHGNHRLIFIWVQNQGALLGQIVHASRRGTVSGLIVYAQPVIGKTITMKFDQKVGIGDVTAVAFNNLKINL